MSAAPAGTVSRCPFQASDRPPVAPIAATTLGRPASPRTISGAAPSAVSTSAATPAAASSVPPGFSDGAAISARAQLEHLVGVDGRGRRLGCRSPDVGRIHGGAR